MIALVVILGMGAAPPAKLTAEQEKADRHGIILFQRAQAEWKAGKHAEAVASMEESLAIYQRVHGRDVQATVAVSSWLATWEGQRGRWKQAAAHHERLGQIQAALWGEGHPKAVDARWEARTAGLRAGWTKAQNADWDRAETLNQEVFRLWQQGQPEKALPLAREALKLCRALAGEKHPDVALCLFNLAAQHHAMGDHKAALPLYQQALKLTEEVQGRRHPQYAASLNNLATLHHDLGDHRSALPLYQQALKLREEVLGRRHPHYAQSLNNLAGLYEDTGDHQTALPLYQQALKLKEEVQGRRHPDYTTSLHNLALLHQTMGDQKAALPLYQQALKLTEEVMGRRHPAYAASLSGLALLHQDMGDHKAALPLLQQVLKLTEEVLGRRHPAYATSLNNLAGLYSATGDHKAALLLFQQALKLREEVLGKRHPDYAASLINLAGLHKATGDHKAALPLYRQALKLCEEVLGRRHPHYATTLNNLAGLYSTTGDHKAALLLFQHALTLREEVLGRRHPDYATTLNNMATLHLEQGRPGAALPFQELALYLTRRHLDEIASVQAERQQHAAADALRYRLNVRLSIPDEAAHFSHHHVLAWKGSTFAAQQARRRFLLAEADPATRALAQELRDAARSLSLLASRNDDASRKRALELLRDKEALEARLANVSSAFRLAVRPPSSESFRASLPPGTVLVDFLVHSGYDPDRPRIGQEWQRRLVCWVVRPDAATVRVDLGPVRPVEQAIESWRKAIEDGGNGGTLAPRLRDRVWAPLEKHVAGAKVVLVSPDEAIGKLPFAALPGREKGKYLLEEAPLAMLPVPRVLSQLLDRPKGKASLLTLGGVEYGEKGTWPPLPATGPEGDAIADRFRMHLKGEYSSLSGAKATRAALRDALPKHRFAHLATHGYFAPASMKSVLDRDPTKRLELTERDSVSGWDPAMLSGLVLAGANRPTLEDDGLLKASEIAELDLSNVELAVLSACQTGLGKEAGGEGILGLQRAFAVAGAKSVVSSLWSVHDAATSVLMERFYHHLWVKKLSKLEALRQAQLDVLRNPEWVEQRTRKLIADLGADRVRGPGRFAVTASVTRPGERRSPPAWWAAWQLSGDWR